MHALLSADEFLAIAETDDARLELVRVEVRCMTPVAGDHGTVGANLYDRVMPFVRARRLG